MDSNLLTTDSIPGQLDALRVRHIIIADRIGALETSFTALEGATTTIASQLAANTEITKSTAEITNQIKDLMIAGKVGTQIIKWVGSTVIGAAALWTAVKVWAQ